MVSLIELQLDGRQRNDLEFKIAKIVTFRYLTFWNSSNNISPQNRKSDWAQTWWDASERHRDSELSPPWNHLTSKWHQNLTNQNSLPVNG